MRGKDWLIRGAICGLLFASARAAHAQVSFARSRHDALPTRAAGPPMTISIPLAAMLDLGVARSGIASGSSAGSLLRLANLRTVSFARDVSATVALSRRSVGVRFTIRM